jgi:putative component of membrane protein insertase Oxa1/YidC/SpoIIIJ protein YidD
MKALALALIGLYQRHLSPRKGFCCAYRFHTGAASCSALGHRGIRRHGLRRGLALLDRRLARCGLAHRRYGPRRPALRSEAGVCEVGEACDCFSGGAEALQCCDACDWRRPDTRRKGRKPEDPPTHLPPSKRKGAAGPAGRADWVMGNRT